MELECEVSPSGVRFGVHFAYVSCCMLSLPSTPNTSARSLITHTSINFTYKLSILHTTYQEVAAFLEGRLLISFLSP